MVITLLAVLFIVAYGTGLYFWTTSKTWRLSNNWAYYFKYLHYTFLGLTLIAVLLNLLLDQNLRGLWTTRIIIMGLLTTGILFYPFTKRDAETKFEKNYFKIFSCLPIGVAGLLLIPFIGIIITLTLLGRLTDPAFEIFYEDDKLRIQSTYLGVIGPPQLDIIEKKGLFEKRHYRIVTHDEHFDSLKVQYDTDSTRIIMKSSNEYIQPIKTISIEKVN